MYYLWGKEFKLDIPVWCNLHPKVPEFFHYTYPRLQIHIQSFDFGNLERALFVVL